MEEMKPCPNPWCSSHRDTGFSPFVHYYESGCYFRVRCPVCPQIGPSGNAETEAVAAWNRRTPDADHQAAMQRDGERVGAWQPIETALRDGAFVLLSFPEGAPYVSVGWWDASGWRIVEADPETSFCDPTHWMPLPATPTWESDDA